MAVSASVGTSAWDVTQAFGGFVTDDVRDVQGTFANGRSAFNVVEGDLFTGVSQL